MKKAKQSRGSGLSLLFVPKGLSVEEPITIDLCPQNSKLFVLIENGASIDIVTESSEKRSGPSHIEQECCVKANAQVRWRNITRGGDVSHRLKIFIEGADARADVRWMFHARKEEKQEISSFVSFAAPGGRGDTLIRGVVEDRAVARSYGTIEVGKKGRGTETFLSEHILLLDPKARADALPKLAIETNDVKASHGASVSRIHPEDLFYMTSRGIGEKSARRMLVEGFLRDLLQREEAGK